ncbi:MAG: dihydropteroate synthase [candidate division Zixibacteria bacterium]|nr:dihydropteroate synthase [candidate division Zixibacteria bacterium]
MPISAQSNPNLLLKPQQRGNKPLLMGVVNITPDSFYDGGRYFDSEKAVKRAFRLIEDGADLIDIGGESTRPGSDPVSPREQIERTCPVIRAVRKHSDIPISIDTTSSIVVTEAINAGANIVNDVSALLFDEKMIEVIRDNSVPVILMHMKETPKTMQKAPLDIGIIDEIREFLSQRVKFCGENGIPSSDIIVDPGIGFGKTVAGNLEIIRNIDSFNSLGKPVLIGASRKSFIGKITGAEADERLAGSLAVACYCAIKDVDILRVHDVKETKNAIEMISSIISDD